MLKMIDRETRKMTNRDDPARTTRAYPQRPIVSVHAAVFRGDRVLLGRRAHEPGRGRWSVPGGAIELGETIHDAARREVREECGVEIEIEGVVDVVDNIIPDESGCIRFHYVIIYLLARYVSGMARPNSDASELRWATQAELDQSHPLDMHPLARQALQCAFEFARESGLSCCRSDL